MAEIILVKTEDINKYKTKKFTTNVPKQSASEIKPLEQSYTPEYAEMMLLSGNPDQMAAASSAVSAGSNVEIITQAGDALNDIKNMAIEAATNLKNDVTSAVQANINDLSNIKSFDDFGNYVQRNISTLQIHIFDASEAVVKFLENIKDGIETAFANTSATQLEMYGALDPIERDSALSEVAANIAKDNTGEVYDSFWQSDLGRNINDKSYIKEDESFSSFVKGGTTMGLYVLASLTPPGWVASAFAVTGESAEHTLSEGGNINNAIVGATPMVLLDMGLNVIGGGSISKLIRNSFKKTPASGAKVVNDVSSNIWHKELSKITDDVAKLEKEVNSIANETKQLESQRILLREQLSKNGNSNEINEQINQLTQKITDNNGKLMEAISQRDSQRAAMQRLSNALKEKDSLTNNIITKSSDRAQREQNRLYQINENLRNYEREEKQLVDELNQLSKQQVTLLNDAQRQGNVSSINARINALSKRKDEVYNELSDVRAKQNFNRELLAKIEQDVIYDEQYLKQMVDSLDPTNESAMKFLRQLSSVSDDQNGILINIAPGKNDAFYNSVSNKYVHMGGSYYSWGDTETLIHELGHYLHDAKLSFAMPSNYTQIVSRARVISSSNNKAFMVAKESSAMRKVRQHDAREEMIRQTSEILIAEKNVDPITAKLIAALDVDGNLLKEDIKQGFQKIKNELTNQGDKNVTPGYYKRVVGAKEEREGRYNQIYTASFDDILSAVYGGTRRDLNGKILNHTFNHSEKYFESEMAQFQEMMANFTVLKVRGNTHDLQAIRETFGDEFYNMLESTFNLIMN